MPFKMSPIAGTLRDSQLRQPFSNGSQLRLEPRWGAVQGATPKICMRKLVDFPLTTLLQVPTLFDLVAALLLPNLVSV